MANKGLHLFLVLAIVLMVIMLMQVNRQSARLDHLQQRLTVIEEETEAVQKESQKIEQEYTEQLMKVLDTLERKL